MTKAPPRIADIPSLLEAVLEAAAREEGWRHSPAHDGWISDDYRDDPDEAGDGYEVHPTASDVCFVTGILGHELEALARAIEGNADALKAA